MLVNAGWLCFIKFVIFSNLHAFYYYFFFLIICRIFKLRLHRNKHRHRQTDTNTFVRVQCLFYTWYLLKKKNSFYCVLSKLSTSIPFENWEFRTWQILYKFCFIFVVVRIVYPKRTTLNICFNRWAQLNEDNEIRNNNKTLFFLYKKKHLFLSSSSYWVAISTCFT